MNTGLLHVVDDDDAFRAALLRLLRAAGYEVRGYASVGEFLLHPPADTSGCLVLDLHMPGGPSGLDLQEALASHGVALPVIFLTGHADVPASVRAMKAGAVDFLTKPVERETLLEAVARALAHDASQRTARHDADALRARFATLSRRENEILERIAAGMHNRQIASELGIAERTVKLHRAHAMRKLGVTSPAELGCLAERMRRLSEP